MYFVSTKKMVKGNHEYWIDGTTSAIKDLKSLLGNNAVKQR